MIIRTNHYNIMIMNKFLFENADVLVGEKYVAHRHVVNEQRDILKVSLEFISNNTLRIDKKFIPLGTVRFCSAHMKNMSISIPDPLDYPLHLHQYLDHLLITKKQEV